MYHVRYGTHNVPVDHVFLRLLKKSLKYVKESTVYHAVSSPYSNPSMTMYTFVCLRYVVVSGVCGDKSGIS